MSDYFRHARIVSRSLAWARKTAPMPVGPNLGLSRDGIRFLDPIAAARNPASWIGAFQAAIDTGTEVAEETLSCVQQHVDRYRADDFFPEAQDRAALLALLKPRQGLYARLSEMHDCGLLGRVFPEFQAVSWRVVRDFYHKYTVDEHTLLTIRNLERIRTPTNRIAFASETSSTRSASPSCWSSRCCCTTWGSGATTITRPRASAWHGTSSIACTWPARRARRSCS